MPIVLYESDKTTPLTGSSLSSVSAGTDSGYVDGWAFNTGNTTARNVLLIQQTKHPVIPNTYLSAGLPPQDQMWGRFAITGFDNTAEPTWSGIASTAVAPMGAYGGVLLGDIPAGCGVGFRYRQHPPSGADDNTGWVWSLRPVFNEYSQPMPAALGFVDRGVLTGIGDGTRSGIVGLMSQARILTAGDTYYMRPSASGSPDDKVTIEGGLLLYGGKLSAHVYQQFTLNQTAAAGSLTAGQLYYAAISINASGRTATKGVRGTSPAKPTVPAGDILLGYVRVRYQAGGTSVIDSTDITDWRQTTYLDRYFGRDGGGLNFSISAGQAIGGGTWRYSQGEQIVALDDDTTCYVWQLASGLFDFTTTDTAPETTALKFYEVDTASGSIAEIRDCRTYAGESVTITLRGQPPGSPGSIERTVVCDEHLIWDPSRSLFWEDGNGGGASGSEDLDLLVNGATAFTSFATEDWRPTFNFNESSATQAAAWALPEVLDLFRGDVLDFQNRANPSGGTPSLVMAQLVCQKAAA